MRPQVHVYGNQDFGFSEFIDKKGNQYLYTTIISTPGENFFTEFQNGWFRSQKPDVTRWNHC